MDKADEVLKKIENDARATFLPIIGRRKGEFLKDIVIKHRSKRILEIGTLVGYSAIILAGKINGKVMSIELSPRHAEIARENITQAGLKNVNIIVGDALDLIPSLEGKFDMIFLDAAKEDYLAYLQLLERNNLLTNGCVIAADNAKIFSELMKNYLEYVRNSGTYDSEYHDFGDDAIEVSVRKL